MATRASSCGQPLEARDCPGGKGGGKEGGESRVAVAEDEMESDGTKNTKKNEKQKNTLR